MRSNALYFPYIAVPESAWTARALLYWDKLSSIIPWDHLHHPDQLAPHMQQLLTEGLVEPIMPGRFVHEIERFDQCFIDLIEKRLARQGDVAHRSRQFLQSTRIHAEKLGQIPNYLVDMGLARRIDWAWYDVETPTANLFMSYLAVCLGSLREVDATPVTNSALIASTMLPPPGRTERREVHAHKTRELVLKELLPVPVGRVDLDQLVRFKRKHGHLLPDLRAKVEIHCTRVAALTSSEDRIEANEAFIRDARQQIAEIEAAMRPSFGDVVFGSITPLFGAGLALHGADPGDSMTYTGAAASFAGAAYMAIASIRNPRAAVSTRPLAYLAHARRLR